MSPCLVLALLVPKKDATMTICVDSRAIKKIRLKYYCPIPKLDDMFDELHCFKVLSEVYLKYGY